MDEKAQTNSRAQALIDRATGSVDLHIEGMVAEIALSNGAMNLVTRPMLRQLNRAISELAGREDIRCVILHGGTAKAFCAGSDIKEFDDLRQDASEYKILFEDMVIRNLARLPMPTIAAVEGVAFGGGCELALSCDLRVLGKDAKIGLTECALGIIPGAGGTQRLPRLIGPAKAKELIFTARRLSADDAAAYGLANQVVAAGSVVDTAKALAAEIAGCAPAETAGVDVDGGLGTGISEGLLLEARAYEVTLYTEDRKEALAAFAEKRKPVFKGR